MSTNGMFYQFAGFGLTIENAWERYKYENRDNPDLHENLALCLNHESSKGNPEQIEYAFRYIII